MAAVLHSTSGGSTSTLEMEPSVPVHCTLVFMATRVPSTTSLSTLKVRSQVPILQRGIASNYQLGPIVLTNRQASTPSFPVQNSWVFYKLTIDPSVLSFQAVVNQNIQFYMTNKTSIYPTSYTPSTLNSNSVYVPPFGYYSCLQINYPYPGKQPIISRVFKRHNV